MIDKNPRIQETQRPSDRITVTHTHTHTPLGTSYSNDWRKNVNENILKADRENKRHAEGNRKKNYCRLLIKTHANQKILE